MSGEHNFDELKMMMAKLPKAERDALMDKMRAEVDAVAVQEEDENKIKQILIVDDLGVITFQLERMFQKYNFEVTVSQEIYDAISKFKKGRFDVVVIDLFIPTEREGFLLLDELKKISQIKKEPVKIGVMTASNKKDHKLKCHQKGATFYIEKSSTWQKDLIEVCKNL